MRITCTNFRTSVDLATATRDQVLMAVTADCCLINGDTNLELPDVAILWFVDNLIRSCRSVLCERSAYKLFRDFYGEYEVNIQFSNNGSVDLVIQTGDTAFAGTLIFQEIRDDLSSILSLAEGSLYGISGSIAFRQIKVELLGFAQQLASPCP